LDLIDTPASILSASKDRRVRAWDRLGKYYGTLRQAEGSTRTWNFPMDDGKRREAETKKVEEVNTINILICKELIHLIDSKST
jgi:hypothetical protein